MFLVVSFFFIFFNVWHKIEVTIIKSKIWSYKVLKKTRSATVRRINTGKSDAFFFDLAANHKLSLFLEKDSSCLKLKLVLNSIATPALAPVQQLKIVSYPHSTVHIEMFIFSPYSELLRACISRFFCFRPAKNFSSFKVISDSIEVKRAYFQIRMSLC